MSQSRLRRSSLTAIAMGALLLAVLPMARASLVLVQPDPLVGATFVGNGGYSADGLGQNGTGGTMQAEVPVGSTVEQAYLYATYFTAAPTAAELALDLDGTVHNLTPLGVTGFLSSARADVTTQVAAKVALGPGPIYNFAMNTDPGSMDGTGLVVIYSNPALPKITIAVLDGEQAFAGDSVTFNFAAPLDKTIPGFTSIMSLGIGFGFQGGATSNECGTSTQQFSTVNVNTVRMTSCAGNFDDGVANNGGLITVGGVGDDLLNPADPLQQAGDSGLPRVEDDELYDIASFMNQGDTKLVVDTANPSNDDGVFLAVVAVTAEATVTTEICTDGIDNDGDGLIDLADPDCVVQPPAGGQRMTGGGTVSGTTAKHGFTLQCVVEIGKPNRLQVNWGKGNRFHLEELTSVACSDDPAINPGSPVSSIDTIRGSGTGRYNGVSGATVEFLFSDAGEPGVNDVARIRVLDASSTVVLDVSGTVKNGNHQAHDAS